MTVNVMVGFPNDSWQWWQLIFAPLFVALCTFLGGLAWAAARAAGDWIRFRINQVIVECPLRLKWLEDAIAEEPGDVLRRARLYCLVIRFGTDRYLADMASDRERYEGRLINRVIAIDRETLALPVHRRLGTQFKLYYLVPEGTSAGDLWEALREPVNRGPNPTHAGDKIILDDEKPHGRKLWFRLAAYGAQRAVDRSENSFFGASRVNGFERRNRLRLSRWTARAQPE